MERFNELLEKKVLNNAEMDELLDMVDYYKEFENCGTSGQYPNCTWYSITLNDDTEVDIYCNCK